MKRNITKPDTRNTEQPRVKLSWVKMPLNLEDIFREKQRSGQTGEQEWVVPAACALAIASLANSGRIPRVVAELRRMTGVKRDVVKQLGAILAPHPDDARYLCIPEVYAAIKSSLSAAGYSETAHMQPTANPQVKEPATPHKTAKPLSQKEVSTSTSEKREKEPLSQIQTFGDSSHQSEIDTAGGSGGNGVASVDVCPAGEPAVPPKLKVSKKTVMPGDWVMPDAFVALARELGLTDSEIKFEGAKFKHWALHTTHRGKPLLRDWSATWRNWASRVAERNRNRQAMQGHNQRPSIWPSSPKPKKLWP